jgi:ATP phosphoribosyltransferase
MKVLDLLFPDREHLCPRVAALLEGAGYDIPDYALGKRIYNPEINVKYFKVTVRRPLQIAKELARGEADMGVTGLDCLREFPGATLLLDIQEPVTQFVLAVPDTPDFAHIKDLQSFIHYVCPGGVTIWSEYPSFLRQYLTDHPAYRSKYKDPPGLDLGWHISLSESPVIIRLSHGATEGNQFFADTTQTNSTIMINGSKVVHTLLERSTPWLVASSQALCDPWKRAKIMEFKLRLEAVINDELKSKTEEVRRQSRNDIRRKKRRG